MYLFLYVNYIFFTASLSDSRPSGPISDLSNHQNRPAATSPTNEPKEIPFNWEDDEGLIREIAALNNSLSAWEVGRRHERTKEAIQKHPLSKLFRTIKLDKLFSTSYLVQQRFSFGKSFFWLIFSNLIICFMLIGPCILGISFWKSKSFQHVHRASASWFPPLDFWQKCLSYMIFISIALVTRFALLKYHFFVFILY